MKLFLSISRILNGHFHYLLFIHYLLFNKAHLTDVPISKKCRHVNINYYNLDILPLPYFQLANRESVQ